MPSRPVHWYEGMFLQPQHLQAADRYASESLRRSEDWFHPFNWGFRTLDLDRDAVANSTAAVRACGARFKDGTKLSMPEDAEVDPIELKGALSSAAGEVTVYLAVPTLQKGRANVEPHPTADGPRYWVDTQDFEDENTGGFEQPVQFRRTRARLLLSGQDQTGYEVLPMARIVRSAEAGAAPQIDTTFVPPLLAIDGWAPLWRAVQGLHHQIGARIEQMAAQLIDRGISLESQVPGDAERMLKLSVLNGAFSCLESFGYIRGLHPLSTYRELCRLVGQLAIFSEARRPPNLPGYDHEDLGGCFHAVIKYIRLGLDTIAPSAFEKRYFERAGERLQVSMEPDWLTNTRSLFLGVETELSDQECQEVLDAMDMKVGSSAQVENYFRRRLKGLRLTPVARPPRALPAGAGTVYFQIERDQVFWNDVADTYTLGIRMNLAHAMFQGDKKLSVALPKRNKDATFQFALYVI
jgi:type VI secretion system protein ImpJ